MSNFRYQALGMDGNSVSGVVEASTRKVALHRLGERGLFPSFLESCSDIAGERGAVTTETEPGRPRIRVGARIKRREITALTRELATLLQATIPIPVALDSLGEEEENPALRQLLDQISASVRMGASLSTALEEHPQCAHPGVLVVDPGRGGRSGGSAARHHRGLSRWNGSGGGNSASRCGGIRARAANPLHHRPNPGRQTRKKFPNQVKMLANMVRFCLPAAGGFLSRRVSWLGGQQDSGLRSGTTTVRPPSDLVGRVRVVSDRRTNSLLLTSNVHYFPRSLSWSMNWTLLPPRS